MKDIKVTELTEENELSAEEAAAVKGGPAYIKIGDIKGEARLSRPTIQKPAAGYTEVEWTY